MGIARQLFGFAIRPLAGAVVGNGVEAVAGVLTRHFTDHSRKLTDALQASTDRAWRALEVALAGESLTDRLARSEDRELRGQLCTFIDAALSGLPADNAFRQRCLRELRAARKAGKLSSDRPDPRDLASLASGLSRFSDPQALLDAERADLQALAKEFAGDYPNLARLLELGAEPGRSLLVVSVRYFFRRAIEQDQELFQGLTFARLERLGDSQEQGFAALDALLTKQGERVESLLGELQTLVAATHDVVLGIFQNVQQLLAQNEQLHKRELRPRDSLSIRSDAERELVKQVVGRYRALPEEERQRAPELLNAIGKLEVVVGDFDAAQKDFEAAAAMESDDAAKAEAHFNAYRVALERRDWKAAVEELVKAVRLDRDRYVPFPANTYRPVRILGAGGFGVAFLCKHKYMDTRVVVKTLLLDDLGRETDSVFTEARALRELDHHAIIRITDCGYTDAATKSRPFLVMDYFDGATLEDHVGTHGPMPVDEFLPVGRQVAEGLLAAHAKDILHRDVKPANLLVRKDDESWKVKLIDFGLAVKQKVAQASTQATSSARAKTLTGASIAGTLDYAAPEQMGRRAGAIGPPSDVYGWAKTCCYALFGTPQPRRQHWASCPTELAELLDSCLADDPAERPANFAEVLVRFPLPSRAVAVSGPPPLPVAVRAPATIGPPPLPNRPGETATPQPKAAPLSLVVGPEVARPPLPDPAEDQGYSEYLTRVVSQWTDTDPLRLNGAMPRHPDLLARECQRLGGLSGFVKRKLFGLPLPDPWGDSARSRYRFCLMALESWAYFYPEYRGTFINLWNQTAKLFEAQEITPDYFSRSEIIAKYGVVE